MRLWGMGVIHTFYGHFLWPQEWPPLTAQTYYYNTPSGTPWTYVIKTWGLTIRQLKGPRKGEWRACKGNRWFCTGSRGAL